MILTTYNLNRLAENINQANKDKGFYDGYDPSDDRQIIEKLFLITSEVAEAGEAMRDSIRVDDADSTARTILRTCNNDMVFKDEFKTYVKDTFEDEVADILIRTLDLAGWLGIDIEAHVQAKLKYNATRPNKHGRNF